MNVRKIFPIARRLGLAAPVVALMLFPWSVAQAQTGTTVKKDSVKKTVPAAAKAPATTTAKPSTAPTKPTTTTAKPTTTPEKPASTTAKPAAAPVEPATKKASVPASTPVATPARTRVRAATTGGGVKRSAPVESYSRLGFYAGGASAGLGFGAGPSAGIVWRKKPASFPLVLRADISASRFSQQPLTVAGAIAGDASLLHMGAALGVEWVLTSSGTLRPYVAASGGAYRFQGSGPAGINGTLPGGVFTSTTDGALLVGAGLRIGQRMFLEARVVHVGDFRTIPFVVGVHF